jgi:hypothetical protein
MTTVQHHRVAAASGGTKAIQGTFRVEPIQFNLSCRIQMGGIWGGDVTDCGADR